MRVQCGKIQCEIRSMIWYTPKGKKNTISGGSCLSEIKDFAHGGNCQWHPVGKGTCVWRGITPQWLW